MSDGEKGLHNQTSLISELTLDYLKVANKIFVMCFEDL